MRKIFLDIGAFNGISAEFFLKHHPEAKEFEIYSFECDRRNIEIIKKKNLPINLIEKAVWVHNGMMPYYYGKSDGGTMFPEKTTGGITPEKFHQVETISIVKFIRYNFKKDDYIIMKMNCEGAEYILIPFMNQFGLIDWINKWYVQWHYEKIKMDYQKHLSIKAMIPESYSWEAQLNDPDYINKFKSTLNEIC